jgi:hypothetical protein
VNADPSVAGVDVALERSLLRVVEHVAGREQEDDGVVAGEVRVRERASVLGRVDREAVLRAERRDRLHRGGDRRVSEAGRLVKTRTFGTVRGAEPCSRRRQAERDREHQCPLHLTIVPAWSPCSPPPRRPARIRPSRRREPEVDRRPLGKLDRGTCRRQPQ